MESSFKMAQRLFIAKAIEELHFEEVLKIHSQDGQSFSLELDGANYFFEARYGAFGHVWVDPHSLKREVDSVSAPLCASAFMKEARSMCDMDVLSFGTFLEELAQTIYSDKILLNKQAKTNLDQLSKLSIPEIDGHLNGHPKLLLNKGRLGWGFSDIERYSPEGGRTFQLKWLAAKKDSLVMGLDDELNNEALLKESLASHEIEKFKADLGDRNLEDWFIFPVHPWQWRRYIQIQFQDHIYHNELVYLGKAGDFYRPQASVRTLSNVYRPWKSDIKLSLSILNTSCVRGIPPKYIKVGHKLSKFISGIIAGDELFKRAGTESLNEKAAISMRNKNFDGLDGVAYRYHEMLGVVWRSSALEAGGGVQVVPTAALAHRQFGEGYLIEKYIKESKLAPSEWFELYFKKVFIPLYHLQLAYGIGLVAHGQNILLKMKDGIPVGMALKDFHGDLRFSEDIHALAPELDSELDEVIEKLPHFCR